jgi:hypothetical protein
MACSFPLPARDTLSEPGGARSCYAGGLSSLPPSLGGVQEDLQHDARRSWREARWPVGDDHSKAATNARVSRLGLPAR